MQAKHARILALILLAGPLHEGKLARAQTLGQALPATHPSNLHVLTPADHDLYARAFAAADHGDWSEVLSLSAQGQDPIARRLVQWRMVSDAASGASFADIDSFLKEEPGWPLRETLLARAEQVIPPEMSNEAVIAWFGGRTPLTSPGRIRLGDALIAVGKTVPGQIGAGRELVRQGWILGSFDAATEDAIEQRDGASFTPQIEAARLDSLIWRDEITAARRQIARVGPLARTVAEARIALRSGLGRAAAKAIAQIPTDGASDPDLLFDRAQAERHAGHDDAAHALLLRVEAAPMVRGHLARWWAEANVEARDALGEKDARTAYALVEHAGLVSGDEFAEAEFLAGFIALRFLDEPKAALAHFETLDANVSRPISKARAHYWEARAYEAMTDKPNAWRQFNLAAAAPETFYGQLALARIDAAPVLRLADIPVDAALESSLAADARMPAMRVLADLGQGNLLRLFTVRDAEDDPAPSHIKRLILDLTDWGYREIAVRLAKTASYTGTAMLSYTYPVIPLPPYTGPGTEPDAALVLGVIRQETEFDPMAVSVAGARGLMQVMTFTARKSAKEVGLPYRPDDLLADSNYNIQLGMIELANRLGDWNGSLILAAAAYNAGPTKARRWMAANGDPRLPTADPVDWIEEIPFSETRNYVQRVIENTEVYRNRLTGRDAPLRILADLYAPNPPSATVLDYTPPVAAPRPN